MSRRYRIVLLAVFCFSWIQLTGPRPVLAQEPVTLWEFLGIPQTMRHLRLQTLNRNGRFPGLEPKPPLRAIADPSHLPQGAGATPGTTGPGQPVVASASFRTVQEGDGGEAAAPSAVELAAQIKQAEDEAPQKIKALRYLATVGCANYPVDKALLEAIDPQKEPNEEVRHVAVQAIMETIGNQCETCNTGTCCTKELIEGMAKFAFQRDRRGCWLEPSERIREALQEALQKCCPWDVPITILPETDLPDPDDTLPPIIDARVSPSNGVEVGDLSVHPTSFSLTAPDRQPSGVALTTAIGTVLNVDNVARSITIACPDEGLAVVGSVVTVRREFFNGVGAIGTLKVVEADPGYVFATPQRLNRPLKVGDEVVVFMQTPIPGISNSHYER